MYCISISYVTASVEIRKKLAFSAEEQKKFIKKAVSSGFVNQCVLLCTCNRTEVYFDGKREAFQQILTNLSDFGGFEADELAAFVMNYFDTGAITHLFRLAAGLDSMVLGEDEILRQIRDAYASAKECGAVSGDFNIIFQSAFAASKKVKTETFLSKSSVSVATLAANEAARFAENVNVLIIGATGKTGMTVMKNLISHKNVKVTATVRNHNRDFLLTAISSDVRMADYHDRYEFVNEADCIISATSSPHFTITGRELKKHITDKKQRVLIDLAVPPDIDESVTSIGGVHLIGIDYFEQLADENNMRKEDSAEAADQMIAVEIDELKKELIFRRLIPEIERLNDFISGSVLYRLRAELTSDEFEKVLNIILKNVKEG